MKNKLKYIAIIMFIGLASLGYYIYRWECRKPLLEVHFFGLTRGRAIFIRTPTNETILVGGGQNSEVIRELTKAMPFYQRAVDVVVIPSASAAQIGGLPEILDRFDVGEVIKPKIMATSTVLDQLMRDVRKQKIHIHEVERGDHIEIEKNLNMKVLFPYENFKFNKTSLPELGLAIEYKNTNAYLLGNLSKTIQKDILKNTEMKSDQNIVEFYNSGGESKVDDELIEKIKPIFTFTTKEKTTSLVSDGFSWEVIK